MKVQVSEIKERCVRLFMSAGESKEDAEIITDVLAQTEMRGVFTHGFYRVPNYINCLKTQGISPECELKIVSDSPSFAIADGQKGLGIVLSYKAMQLAISKAKQTGIGMVGVNNSHHFGAAGYYTGMCADEKMIGMSMSNGDVLIAATGSRIKSIGNNPFSFAAPAGRYDKVVYDIAMSHTSDKKVVKLAREGKPVPEGWLIDKNGVPTTDASEYEKGGCLMPFGGYKGYGMAMMVEVLAAVMTGAAMTTDVHAWNTDSSKGGNVGHLFIAIDVEKLMSTECFEERMEKMIDGIKASEKAEGVTERFYPGEMELSKLAAGLESGVVEIDDATMEAFEAVEREYNV